MAAVAVTGSPAVRAAPPAAPLEERAGTGGSDGEDPPTTREAHGEARLPEAPTDDAIVEAARLHGTRFSFAEVVRASTGHRVLPIHPDNGSPDAAIVRAVGEAAARVVAHMNRSDSPVRGLRRINEASRFFEDRLRSELDADPGFTCGPPESQDGRLRRSGYPDLELVHGPSGRTVYLDPKLFETGSRDGSLRTFYFQPDTTGGGKVRRDAHHLLVGFEHDGRDGAWRFLGWHLVDLTRLEVRLKSEFQASNRDLYATPGILRSGSASDGPPATAFAEDEAEETPPPADSPSAPSEDH